MKKRFEKVSLKKEGRRSNPYFIQKYFPFPLRPLLEIKPITSHCENNFGEFLKERVNPKLLSTASRDCVYVAILLKSDDDKHLRLLEIMNIAEFINNYKIID